MVMPLASRLGTLHLQQAHCSTHAAAHKATAVQALLEAAHASRHTSSKSKRQCKQQPACTASQHRLSARASSRRSHVLQLEHTQAASLQLLSSQQHVQQHVLLRAQVTGLLLRHVRQVLLLHQQPRHLVLHLRSGARQLQRCCRHAHAHPRALVHGRGSRPASSTSCAARALQGQCVVVLQRCGRAAIALVVARSLGAEQAQEAVQGKRRAGHAVRACLVAGQGGCGQLGGAKAGQLVRQLCGAHALAAEGAGGHAVWREGLAGLGPRQAGVCTAGAPDGVARRGGGAGQRAGLPAAVAAAASRAAAAAVAAVVPGAVKAAAAGVQHGAEASRRAHSRVCELLLQAGGPAGLGRAQRAAGLAAGLGEVALQQLQQLRIRLARGLWGRGPAGWCWASLGLVRGAVEPLVCLHGGVGAVLAPALYLGVGPVGVIAVVWGAQLLLRVGEEAEGAGAGGAVVAQRGAVPVASGVCRAVSRALLVLLCWVQARCIWGLLSAPVRNVQAGNGCMVGLCGAVQGQA